MLSGFPLQSPVVIASYLAMTTGGFSLQSLTRVNPSKHIRIQLKTELPQE